jgi:cell division protein FtsQ
LGALHTPKSEVLQASGLSRRPPLLDVNPGAVSRRLDRLPWVLDASVHIEWPSTVAVALEERVPVAAARLEDGLYAIFDVSGRVLADSAKRPVGLPLVAVPGAGEVPGSFLGARARLVLSAAAGLPESLVARVEEITASSSDGVELKLNGGLRAVVGDDEALAEKYVSLATVLRRVDLTGVGAIDLRVAAAPVLTPLVTASNVHGKGDG